MIVLEKHYHYFFTLFCPILLITILIMLCFMPQVEQTFPTQAVCFLLACLGILIKGGKAEHAGKRLPIQMCLKLTLLFQAALFVHFYECGRLMLNVMPINLPPHQHWPWAHQLMQGWPLFPWTFYTCTAIAFTTFCYQHGKEGFLSDAVAPLIRNHRNDSISQFINHIARGYVLAPVVLCAVFCLVMMTWLTHIYHIKLSIGFNPHAFLLSTCALLPFTWKKCLVFIERMMQYKTPLLTALILTLLAYIAYLGTISYLIPKITEGKQPLGHFHALFLPGTQQNHWILFMAFLMLAWTPIAAGVMAYLWRGYHPRLALIGQLIIPGLLIVGFNHFNLNIPSHLTLNDCLLSLGSLLAIGGILFRKKTVVSLIRTQAYGIHHKYRSPTFLLKSMLLSISLFCSIYVMTGFEVLSFIMLMSVAFNFYFCAYSVLSLFVPNKKKSCVNSPPVN